MFDKLLSGNRDVSCSSCHDPHGSSNEKMLVARLPMLCQRCHIGTRHPSRPLCAPPVRQNVGSRRAAAAWLAERTPGRVEVRFDVVSAIVADGRLRLTHIPNAF